MGFRELCSEDIMITTKINKKTFGLFLTGKEPTKLRAFSKEKSDVSAPSKEAGA